MSAKSKTNSQIRATLIEFINAIKDGINIERIDSDWEADVKKYLGVDETKLVSIETTFPLYQQSQACYAINKFLEDKTKVRKVVNYEGEYYSAPKYQEIEVKRNQTVPLLTSAWIITKWRRRNLVVHVMFEGNYSSFTVFGLKKNEEIIHDLSAKTKEWMRVNNFLRGERLEFLPHAKLGFLEYRKVNWNSVILPKELKDGVILNIVFPLSNEKLCVRHNIPWRRGVLLAGVAGTGKTQLGRVLCNVLNKKVTVIWVSPKALHDVEKVQLVFEAARYFSPTLLVIEDIDFIGRSRDFNTDHIVGELLTQLDGSASNHGVFILASTNRPELLDKALVERPSRFDVKLIFKLPDEKQRLKMVKYFSIGKRFKGVTREDIVKMTDGFTGAYIQEVITYGTLLSLQEKKTSIERVHLKKAVKQVKGKVESNKLVS